MKILLLGEYSNVHATLAQGLRALGHSVTVASNGDFWKDYPRDIDLQRREGRRGTLGFLARLACALPRMRGYDVVQIINPMFLELRAERLFSIYRYLRRHNRRVVMGAFGMDYYWVSVNDTLRPLRYSDFNIGDRRRTDEPAERERRDWCGTAKQRLNEMIAADADAIVAGLYEYWATYTAVESLAAKTRFIPLPIPLAAEPTAPDPAPAQYRADLPPVRATENGQHCIRIFVGISRGRSAYKGTDIMLRAAHDVESEMPDRVEVMVAEGVPFAKYQRMMDNSDVILDQLYAYTPAMNALLAMSKGIVVVGGGEPENYEVLNETELSPIINVAPTYESCYEALHDMALHPEKLERLKRQSVEYVHRHHDHLRVARKYVELYSSLP